ncbi:fatty acid-binding protein-like [Paramacrobiotus metropolitanus]|uniref:fatty acid-binding protein-like n=1 Tax=Paramacrobiotus metropolitanus TaxID=2943436 RepID=UPI0024462434|nr:fatty acid-binding protein-like [Paramacrobiotus metropolitanus]
MDITGRYQLASSENFDEYLKEIGVNFIKRKLASAMDSATVEITKTGDEYHLKTVTPVKTSEVKFVLNETVPEKTMDDRDVQSIFTLDNNVLKQKQSGEKGFESTIDREFNGNEMTATIRYKNVVAVRKYKKIT